MQEGQGHHEPVAGVSPLQPELGRCPWVLGPLSGAYAYTCVSEIRGIRGPERDTAGRARSGGGASRTLADASCLHVGMRRQHVCVKV